MKIIMRSGSIDVDFILELFGLDNVDKNKLLEELKRLPKDDDPV